MKKLFVIFTCEHASNIIPPNYKKYFVGKKKILASHRGFDWGTEYIGKSLAQEFHAPVVIGKFSRLLIDLNRSENHRTAFSEMTKGLTPEEKETIRYVYHRPHWDEVKEIINKQISKGKKVLHIGVHSFTPVFHGEVRTCDLGILYDSRRKTERDFARHWQKTLLKYNEFRVRRNYPYLGKFDGLTSELRKLYPATQYMGLEIEVNQSLVSKLVDLKMVDGVLVKSLKSLIASLND